MIYKTRLNTCPANNQTLSPCGNNNNNNKNNKYEGAQLWNYGYCGHKLHMTTNHANLPQAPPFSHKMIIKINFWNLQPHINKSAKPIQATSINAMQCISICLCVCVCGEIPLFIIEVFDFIVYCYVVLFLLLCCCCIVLYGIGIVVWVGKLCCLLGVVVVVY